MEERELEVVFRNAEDRDAAKQWISDNADTAHIVDEAEADEHFHLSLKFDDVDSSEAFLDKNMSRIGMPELPDPPEDAFKPDQE